MAEDTVLVVGAGISGVACARALTDAGLGVRVVDRGRVPGGRMASRRLDDRYVDTGAAYFTVKPDSGFAAVVDGWAGSGLAREWTDTLWTAGDAGLEERRGGPMRWSARGGLRSLVAELATGLDVEQERTVERVEPGRSDGGDGVGAVEVDGEAFRAVVLAMPDPQARRLLPEGSPLLDRLDDADRWEPTITVVLRYADRSWPADLHAAFVNDSDTLVLIADDGDRRGDGAPVLVAHAAPGLSRAHLDDPDAVIAPAAEAVGRILGLNAGPVGTFAHRWTLSQPTDPHGDPFLLEGGIGVCGDAWSGKSSVGAAWTSGDALGRELAARLR